jgi:hypothetical protein
MAMNVAYADPITDCEILKQEPWVKGIGQAPSVHRASVLSSSEGLVLKGGDGQVTPLGQRGGEAGYDKDSGVKIDSSGDPIQISFWIDQGYSFDYTLSGKGCGDLLKNHKTQLMEDIWVVAAASPEGHGIYLHHDLDKAAYRALVHQRDPNLKKMSQDDRNKKVTELGNKQASACHETPLFVTALEIGDIFDTLKDESRDVISSIRHPKSSLADSNKSDQAGYDVANTYYRQGDACWSAFQANYIEANTLIDVTDADTAANRAQFISNVKVKIGEIPFTRPAEPQSPPQSAKDTRQAN